MSFEPGDAYPGERLIRTKAANAVVDLAEKRASPLPFSHLMPLVGMKGKEAVGGHLHLTSYRLFFESHGFNRFTGKLSILLPSIRALSDESTFIKKQLRVAAERDYLFVVWGVSELTAEIEAARRAIEPHRAQVAALVQADPRKLGNGLHP
jgi:hypothetical protein